MKLQTRVLFASGFFRYGITAGVMFLGFLYHPLLYFVATAWLVWCRKIVHRFLLPPFFPRVTCPSCHHIIELRARWKCMTHYTDHKVRHVLAFHCNQGHELASFECPTPDCGATIQVQKGNRKLLQRGKVADSLMTAPNQNAKRWRKQQKGLLVGSDRQRPVNWFSRFVRRLLGLKTEREVRLFDDVVARHMAFLGGTGMGKSTLIVNMARQIFASGEGATFLDPTGDLAHDLLQQVPEDRIDDVIYIDVSDAEFPFPFNLLHAKDDLERGHTVDEIVGVIKRLSLNWGDSIAQQLRMALKVVLPLGGSMQDVYNLFTDAEERQKLVRQITEKELKEYWTETFPSTRYERRSAVITKLAPIVDHKLLGKILCARECAFDADEIISQRKIVIVNLATGSPADHVTTVLGTFVVNKVLAAAYRQKNLPKDKRIRHYFFVDEFQNFMHRASAFDRILSEVRKYNLVIIVANQFVAQLEDKIRAAIFGNVGCLCVFRLGHQDAKILKDEFDGASKRDLTMLTRGECLMRVGTHCMSVRTPPPPPTPENDPTKKIIERMHNLIKELRKDEKQKDESPAYKQEDVANEVQRAKVLCEFA